MIGLERELRDHEAGLRTHMLVAVGACVFTLVSAYAWTDWTFSTQVGVVFDPTRIAAQIVTGIGFLGARRDHRPRHLHPRADDGGDALGRAPRSAWPRARATTSVAVVTTVLVLVSLWPLQLARTRFVARVRPEEAGSSSSSARSGAAATRARAVEELGGGVESVEFGDERTLDVVAPRARGATESARVAEVVADARRRRARCEWRP